MTRKKSADAKKAAMAAAKTSKPEAPKGKTAPMEGLIPETTKLKVAGGLKELIEKIGESTGEAVRVEYRFERGWLVAVGGKVKGELNEDPGKMLEEAIGK